VFGVLVGMMGGMVYGAVGGAFCGAIGGITLRPWVGVLCAPAGGLLVVAFCGWNPAAGTWRLGGLFLAVFALVPGAIGGYKGGGVGKVIARENEESDGPVHSRSQA
jgi:hypothetical protein